MNGSTLPTSAAAQWPLLSRFRRIEEQLGERAAARGALALAGYEFLRFGIKQAWACMFGGLLIGVIIATRLWYPPCWARAL